MEKIYVGCERKEYGIKPLIIVRYELRSNITPVATTEGTSLRENQSPRLGNPPTALDSPQRTGSSTIPNFVQKSNSNPIAIIAQ
ncbi:MAG: hypothetical protein V7K42_15455 [Nostoc sp.]